MKITVVRPDELGERELAKWRSIQRSNPLLANPFLSPEFTVAVGRLRPRARVGILFDGSDIVGFFPFERRGLGHGVPICSGHNDCQGLVSVPDLEWDPQDLLRKCGLSVWEFDHLVDGQRPFADYEKARVASPIMDLSAGFPIFQEHLRKRVNKFRELTRTRRKLTTDMGEIQFVFDSRDTRALRTVMTWKSAQYLRSGWVDRFASPFMVELLDLLLETRTDGFAGVMSMLYAGDTPVAGHFGLRSDTVMALWFPSYDIGFRNYGPGLIMNHDLAEAACAQGIEQVDMGPGEEPYKQWFGSRDLLTSQGHVDRRSVAGVLHRSRRASVDRIHHTVLQNPSLHRAAKRVRAGYVRADSTLRRRASTEIFGERGVRDGI